MAKQPFISHPVNGYSRYDIPESKAFSCTPGILYPARIQFVNARTRLSIGQGVDVRSNPLAVPSFNPYVMRLHRFFVPLQLYHPEMRVNSSNFDMNDLSFNFVYVGQFAWTTKAVDTGGVKVDSSNPVGGPYFNAEFNKASQSYYSMPNSLMHWLRAVDLVPTTVALTANEASFVGSSFLDRRVDPSMYVNADTYLGYWDIVRNYYSYSQWDLFSFAWPGSFSVHGDKSFSGSTGLWSFFKLYPEATNKYFTQRYGTLTYLDSYFERAFYPMNRGVASSNLVPETYNRSNLLTALICSDIDNSETFRSKYPPTDISTDFPRLNSLAFSWDSGQFLPTPATCSASGGSSVTASTCPVDIMGNTPYPKRNIGTVGLGGFQPLPVYPPLPPAGTLTLPQTSNYWTLLSFFHPMAVVPSSPDRFSRILPPGSTSDAISMSSVENVSQLAVASRLQEYKDLLGAGGSRFSDWLLTFFASKIEHVDRPKLLFSASVTVNVQVVMNQSGSSGFKRGSEAALGQTGGAIVFNSGLGREQSYYFNEPGYVFDMISIRPVYYWTGIHPDYLYYKGSDYFNPLYNDIGYQDLNPLMFGNMGGSAIGREPCFQEFRSSYDETRGMLASFAFNSLQKSLTSYWVQQRSFLPQQFEIEGGYIDSGDNFKYPYVFENVKFDYKPYKWLFVDMDTVNDPFATAVEDNFFVNLSYSVRKKELVNKTFATRLSSR